MERNIEQILGCGKMSRHFLNRITSRFVTGADGRRYPGASGFEQAALIYFKQVCDKKNSVKEYKVQELEGVLGCSKREVHVLLANLVKKGFITANYSDKSWTGIKNIRINDRNFSGVRKFSNEDRYLSAYYRILNPNEKDYEKYRNLSLYAKRLLLVLLYNYSDKYGYRVSYDELAKRLGISKRSLVDSYLKELETVFGKDYYHREKSTKERLYYGMVIVHNKNSMFSQGLENSQDTFYKRKIKTFLQDNMVQFKGTDIKSFVNKLFALIYRYLLGGMSLEQIEEVAQEWIHSCSNEVSLDLIRWIGLSLEYKKDGCLT